MIMELGLRFFSVLKNKTMYIHTYIEFNISFFLILEMHYLIRLEIQLTYYFRHRFDRKSSSAILSLVIEESVWMRYNLVTSMLNIYTAVPMKMNEVSVTFTRQFDTGNMTDMRVHENTVSLSAD